MLFCFFGVCLFVLIESQHAALTGPELTGLGLRELLACHHTQLVLFSEARFHVAPAVLKLTI